MSGKGALVSANTGNPAMKARSRDRMEKERLMVMAYSGRVVEQGQSQ
jgi:hypothetical protein